MKHLTAPRASSIIHDLCCDPHLEGSVVLLPANICPIVPLAIHAAGRTFEFIDINAHDFDIDPQLVSNRLRDTGKPAVGIILYARTYGNIIDATRHFSEWKAIAPNARIVDDRCLCPPETDIEELNPQGSDIVLFSTGYGKPISLDGGGFAFLNSTISITETSRPYHPEAASRIEDLYKAHISSKTTLDLADDSNEDVKLIVEGAWLPSGADPQPWDDRCTAIQAAQTQVEAHRTRLNEIYSNSIPRACLLPEGYHGWRFQIRVPDRDQLLEEIFAAGLFASNHYYPASELFGHPPCPEADRLYARILNLFNDMNFSESQATTLARLLKSRLENE